jgi:hypothetical protein
VPRCGIFLGKWYNSFAGNSDDKMYIKWACALNTRAVEQFLTVPARTYLCFIFLVLSVFFASFFFLFLPCLCPDCGKR